MISGLLDGAEDTADVTRPGVANTARVLDGSQLTFSNASFDGLFIRSFEVSLGVFSSLYGAGVWPIAIGISLTTDGPASLELEISGLFDAHVTQAQQSFDYSFTFNVA